MAREVEVTNIQMTASVPADLQISLGMLSGLGTEADGHGLGDNWGNLVPAIGTSADNGGVANPGDDARYWSNTADVSAYYALGKIMPASSTSGLNLYFTPDASGVGKTIKTGAKYYAAVEQADIYKDANGAEYMTTLHAYTGKTSADTSGAVTAWNAAYKKGTEWNKTNDDGYFVDIPVWIRSSSETATQLSVDAYVSTSSKKDNDDLYLAARAVILNDTRKTSGGLIEIKEDNYSAYTDPETKTTKKTSIVDFMSTTNSTGAAVASTSDKVNGGTATYGAETRYDGTTANGVTVPARSAAGQYGDSVKIWIRVWLEGEDPNCWNENAGQDFNISLKFSREDVELPNTTYFNPQGANTADSASLIAGTVTNVIYNGTTIQYTYNGSVWNANGTFVAAPAGSQYQIGATVIQNAKDLATYLKNNVTTKAQADAGITLTTMSVAEGAHPTQVVYYPSTQSFSGDVTGAVRFNINGKNYESDTEVKGDDSLTGTEYAVTVTYPENIPTYTVTYQTIDIIQSTTVETAKHTLTLMRVDIATPYVPAQGETAAVDATHTYKWYIAAENEYTIGSGVELTDNRETARTDIRNIAAIVDGETGENLTFSTLTESYYEVTTNVAVSVQNAPAALATLNLIKTQTGTDIDWAVAGTYTLPAGAKLSRTVGETTSTYSSAAELCTALSNTDADSVGTISYVAPAVGTYTVSRNKDASSHYVFTGSDIVFPTTLSGYTFQLTGEATGTASADLTALEERLDAYFTANPSAQTVTVTVAAT
jgi:hypothetical protein